MGVKKGEVGEGCFMLKADPCGRKQTDGKGGSENFFAGGILKGAVSKNFPQFKQWKLPQN